MTDFVTAIARRTGLSASDVTTVLEDAGVVLAPAPPAPHSLIVTRVRFRGVKRRVGHDVEEFDYDRRLAAGLWIVASRDNLAGKSTVLNVIRWALTGRAGRLRDDVRSWIDHVTVEGTVDDRVFTIDFDGEEGTPRGTLTDGSGEIGSFDSEAAFESITGAFFSERLGLDPTPFWQRRAAGLEHEGDARRLGWQGYFPALHVRSGSGPLLGEQVQGGQAGTLIQVFLGLPWALTAASARVALAIIRRELSAARRRSYDDAAARERGREPLQARLEAAEARLAAIEAAGAPPTAKQIDDFVTRFQLASAQLAGLRADIEAGRAAVDAAQDAVDDATRRLLAIREGSAVRPLLGRIAPTECPRCTHRLEDVRSTREAHDHCFVCDAPLTEIVEDEEIERETERELRDAEEALAAAQAELAELRSSESAVSAERDAARAAVDDTTRAAPATAAREEATREKAVAEALLAQDQVLQEETHEFADLERRESVLAAAEHEAQDRRAIVGETFRARLGEAIVDLGRRFGIENLEAADPKLSAALRVTIGSVESNYGDLTPGEQLRLRIATLIGLLRIGTEFGIGRFPGLLMIDSPGSEEMVTDDASEILGEIASMCEEQDTLQVIVATARPELVGDLAEGDHWLGSKDLGMVF